MAALLNGCAMDKKERAPAMERADHAADSISADAVMVESSADEETPPDSLSRKELEGYMEIGSRKLKDHADYLSIALDLHYKAEFRKQAEEQAMALFIDGGSDTGRWLKMDELKEELRGHNVKIVVDSIAVARFPQREREGLYRGMVTFRQTITGTQMTKQHSVITKVNRYSASVVIMKIEKKFGNETREVWEVMLDKFEEMKGTSPSPPAP